MANYCVWYQYYNTQGIGEGKLLIPPGMILPGSMIPGRKPSELPTVVALTKREQFLNTQGRQCHWVVANGNCMFRAVSHQLYAKEEFHLIATTQCYSESFGMQHPELFLLMDRKRSLFKTRSGCCTARGMGYSSWVTSNLWLFWSSSVYWHA